ncbi:MAG: amidohydrolase [Anaerolineae bacterium]|nr:amidohydrolase [Anaerolineae bacterium]
MHIGKLPGYAADAEELLRLADRVGFDRIVCSHFGAMDYDMYEGNRQLGHAIHLHPDRIQGYAAITSARYGQRAVDEIQRCHEVYGMRGVKILHRVGGLGSYGLITSINEPFMYPIIQRAAELKLPILAHSTPEECEGLSQVVPDAVIIMAHAGGCPTALGDWNRAILAARRYSNIFLDTTSSMNDLGYIEAAVAAVGPERVLFGTDMPLLDPFFGLSKVTGTELSSETLALLLAGNIQRLMNWA